MYWVLQCCCNAGARATPAATYTVTGSVPSLTPIQLAPVAIPAQTKETPAAITPVKTVLVPAATPAMTHETIQELLADKETPAATVPVETILVPAATPAATKHAIKNHHGQACPQDTSGNRNSSCCNRDNPPCCGLRFVCYTRANEHAGAQLQSPLHFPCHSFPT